MGSNPNIALNWFIGIFIIVIYKFIGFEMAYLNSDNENGFSGLGATGLKICYDEADSLLRIRYQECMYLPTSQRFECRSNAGAENIANRKECDDKFSGIKKSGGGAFNPYQSAKPVNNSGEQVFYNGSKAIPYGNLPVLNTMPNNIALRNVALFDLIDDTGITNNGITPILKFDSSQAPKTSTEIDNTVYYIGGGVIGIGILYLIFRK